MPICAVGGTLLDVLFNPKYASHVYKMTVAVDNLGNIVCICDLMPGTTADLMIWDARGPSRSHGQFFDFELGAHDGAYKGRIHTAVPYISRKKLSDNQQEYNHVHGFYRARVEHFCCVAASACVLDVSSLLLLWVVFDTRARSAPAVQVCPSAPSVGQIERMPRIIVSKNSNQENLARCFWIPSQHFCGLELMLF